MHKRRSDNQASNHDKTKFPFSTHHSNLLCKWFRLFKIPCPVDESLLFGCTSKMAFDLMYFWRKTLAHNLSTPWTRWPLILASKAILALRASRIPRPHCFLDFITFCHRTRWSFFLSVDVPHKKFRFKSITRSLHNISWNPRYNWLD